MDRSRFFDIFVSEQILKNFQPNLDTILYGLVDGEADCGIDGFYCFVNDQPLVADSSLDGLGRNPKIDCIITQCKTSTGFSEQVIEKLNFHLPLLLSFERDEESLSDFAHDKLLEVTRNFLRVCQKLAPLNPQISFFLSYATRGDEVHPNVKSKSKEVSTLLRKKLFPGCMASFSFLGASQLLEFAQQSAQVNSTLSVTEGPLTSDSEQGQGYVCLVTIEEYYRFICNDDGKTLNVMLFESNVRDHEGATDVNKSIGETLRNKDSEDFWWLNNGVTVVSPAVHQMGKRLHLTDPQVVNGLQTSNEIYNYFHAGEAGTVERLLLVRVVVPHDDLARDRIIRATNNQNQLPGSALRATDRIQHSIEEYLRGRGFFYDRRKNYYANQGRKLDRIVSMETLAQCVVTCLLRQPWTARSRVSTILDDDIYDRIFSNTLPLNMYLNVLLLSRRIRIALRGHPQIGHVNVDDWVFHVTSVAVMLLTKKTRPTARDLANTDFQTFEEARVSDLIPVVAIEYAKKMGKSQFVPFSEISKDSKVGESLIKRVENMMQSSVWRQWPDIEIKEDHSRLLSDVFYRSPRRL